MSNTLYFTRANDPNLLQIIIALKFIGQDIKRQEINKKYDPLILLTPQGTINQPISILQFLTKELSGQNERQKNQIWQWFQHFSLELHPLLREINDQMNGLKVVNKQKFDYSTRQLIRQLQNINNHLKLRTFFIGDSVTIVDISLATQLQVIFKTIINEDSRKKVPNVVRWFTYMRSTGPFRDVLGDLQLCGKQSGFQLQAQKKEEKKEA